MKDLTKLILNYIITLGVPGLNTYPSGHSRPIKPDLTCQTRPSPLKFPTKNYQKCTRMCIYIWEGVGGSGVPHKSSQTLKSFPRLTPKL